VWGSYPLNVNIAYIGSYYVLTGSGTRKMSTAFRRSGRLTRRRTIDMRSELLSFYASTDPYVVAGVDVAGVDITGLDVTALDVTALDFTGLDVIGRDVTGVDVTRGDVTGLDVAGVDVTGLDFTGLEVIGRDVIGVDVAGRDVTGLDVIGRDVTGVDVTRGDELRGVSSGLIDNLCPRNGQGIKNQKDS
jgi:uncharacterized protein YjbI with pentapeptide repeats